MNLVQKEFEQRKFRNALQEFLNEHSMETGSNTPDYMLADYLITCLQALNETINRRASWYGRFDWPGKSESKNDIANNCLPIEGTKNIIKDDDEQHKTKFEFSKSDLEELDSATLQRLCRMVAEKDDE